MNNPLPHQPTYPPPWLFVFEKHSHPEGRACICISIYILDLSILVRDNVLGIMCHER